jgi:hypothetical protein
MERVKGEMGKSEKEKGRKGKRETTLLGLFISFPLFLLMNKSIRIVRN